MKFYSLQDRSYIRSFREATIMGQAPGRGLFFPERIPQLPVETIQSLKELPREEIAFQLIAPYAGDDIDTAALRHIVSETIDFPVPLVQVQEQQFALELFHGPTLAFKDTGARFMSRCLGYFVQGENRPVTVLVATSGDTGGAVADGFYGVDGVEVVILYPSGKVSTVQEKQLTTLGKNIRALEVKGSFDDCQRLVKAAFADESLNRELFLTSANSINVARWLPQQFYYAFALQQWQHQQAPVLCVPSGNFGNICAGLLARASGLPLGHFIAACNVNDVVVRYLQAGAYHPQPAVATLSNAMDVGEPSNFVRILELFEQNLEQVKMALSGYTVTDEETRQMILSLLQTTGYLADPHGAVGFTALSRYQETHPGQKGIVLETAHPVKFFDVVEPITGQPVALPASVQARMELEKKAVLLEADYASLRDYLLS